MYPELSGCTFCEIVHGRESAKILAQNENILIIEDINPASRNHFLAIPKVHIKNAAELKTQHIPLLHEMRNLGMEVLQQVGGCLEDSLIGFHWPPFNSVGHLHLHFIFPASEIKSRMTGKFNAHIPMVVCFI